MKLCFKIIDMSFESTIHHNFPKSETVSYHFTQVWKTCYDLVFLSEAVRSCQRKMIIYNLKELRPLVQIMETMFDHYFKVLYTYIEYTLYLCMYFWFLKDDYSKTIACRNLVSSCKGNVFKQTGFNGERWTVEWMTWVLKRPLEK